MNDSQVTPAPPLAGWFVIGRAIVVRTYGVQDRNGVRFWSAVISPIYPNYQELDYRMQFYASIFKDDYFEIGETIQDGDEIVVQGILQPRTELASDGRVRGTMTIKLTHFEPAPTSSLLNENDDDYELFDEGSNDVEDVEEEPGDDGEDPFA